MNSDEKCKNIKDITLFSLNQIKKRKLESYVKNIVFDDEITGYAYYDLAFKEIRVNYDLIYAKVGHYNRDVYLKIMLHEIRHAEQKRIIIKNNSVSLLFLDALKYRNFFESKMISTEIDADINAFLYMILEVDDEYELYKNMIKLYNLIKKKYCNFIPMKEFYNMLNELPTYYYYLKKIHSIYIKLQTGLYLEEKILYEIEKSLEKPKEFKQLIKNKYLIKEFF